MAALAIAAGPSPTVVALGGRDVDLRLDVGFFAHRKTRRLSAQLGTEAVLALQTLWAHTRAAHPSGDLGPQTPDSVEWAARWQGEPGSLYAALVEIGWLDLEDDRVLVHDWPEHQPHAYAASERVSVAREAGRVGGIRSARAREERGVPMPKSKGRPKQKGRVKEAETNGIRRVTNLSGSGSGSGSDRKKKENCRVQARDGSVSPGPYPPEFERFWQGATEDFGKKGSKARAAREWILLRLSDRVDELCEAYASQLEEKRSAPRGEFVQHFQHLERWLHNRRWEDEVEPPPAALCPVCQQANPVEGFGRCGDCL